MADARGPLAAIIITEAKAIGFDIHRPVVRLHQRQRTIGFGWPSALELRCHGDENCRRSLENPTTAHPR